MNLGIDKRSEMVYTNKRRRERHTETQAHDPLAQVVEHLTFNQGVRSSNLRWVTMGYNLRAWRNGRRARLRIWCQSGV